MVAKLADKFGRKKLNEDLAAAMRTAEEGFPVPEWTAAYWADEVDLLRSDEAASKVYLPNDHARGLVKCFTTRFSVVVAADCGAGRDAFYKGKSPRRLWNRCAITTER